MKQNLNLICEDEKAVELLALSSYVMKRWKIVLVAALILALAMGGISYIKSYQASLKSENVSTDVSEPVVSDYDKAAVLAKVEMIEEYKATIEEREYYYEHSIKTKLNANSIPQGNLIYLISADYVEDSAKAIGIID